MDNPKVSARHAAPNDLKSLAPLRNQPGELLERLARQVEVLCLPKGFHIRQAAGTPSHLLFLIAGELRVRVKDGSHKKILAGSLRSHFPLIGPDLPELDALVEVDAELLRIPRSLLNQPAPADTPPPAPKPDPAAAPAQREREIQLELRDLLERGRIDLPGMPDVAVRIARQIDSPQANNEEIARLIQQDPALTARLLHVANSATFGGRSRVETCKDAITRLGRETTRSLVTSFVLRGLFRTRSELIRTRLQTLWLHSTQVAALCHALARRTPGFDPAQALLMGLVHDLGVIPILHHASQTPDLTQDPDLLDRVIQSLRADYSARTLSLWGFREEFVTAAREAEHWMRDHQPQPDYADILVMSQLHAFVATPVGKTLPRLDEVPAFGKLALGRLSPQLSLAVLDEAHQEIEEVRGLLA